MKRAAKPLLYELLNHFPCVAMVGARQCGKTTLVSELKQEEWKIFDLEKTSDLKAITQDPDTFLRLHPEKIIIDEAQLYPALFPALRVAIDESREKPGRYVITGSSSPLLSKNISESLAGRVATIELSPLSFAETRTKLNAIFFKSVANKTPILEIVSSLKAIGTVRDVHEYWLKGGYPEPWVKNNDRFRNLWMESYFNTYIERDVARLFPNLDINKYRLFLTLLSSLSGSIINYSEVGRSLGVSAPTARDYFNIADGTYLWRNIPAYEKDSTKRIVKHSKGYLRDSGIINHLQRIQTVEHLMSHPRNGYLWESLVIEEIIRGLNAIGISFDYYHYRTSGGAEVDFILEGDLGTIPIEIKYQSAISLKDIRGLIDFIDERQCKFGLVITTGDRVIRLKENLFAIPFNYL